VWKFAKELVELRPEVIVAQSSPVVATLLGETRSIPIVFVSISDLVGEGFAHPGGNVTGFTNFESSMTGKWVELLKNIAREITRVGFLFNQQTQAADRSSWRQSMAPRRLLKSKPLWRWFTMMTRSKQPLPPSRASPALVRFCFWMSLPWPITCSWLLWQCVTVCRPSMAIASWRSGVALFPMGLTSTICLSARLLMLIGSSKGAKPADLPVQAPTKFELAVNQKMAKAHEVKVQSEPASSGFPHSAEPFPRLSPYESTNSPPAQPHKQPRREFDAG
jgi:putative tryptophan/tyrosine transport system substrate-binding protein